MRAIWSEDEATFHGRFVDFDRIWSWPKPVQVPHPPVLIGGDGPGTLDRVLEDGDGWMPNYPRELAHLERRMADLAERAADRGRGRVPVTVFLAPADVDVLTALEALGVERSLLRLPPGPIERAEATLASYLPLLALDPTV
jgi:alkanesulfonate monooxygenase SsuD/methylene tetrahydromethanopterin reductase-like flavin-dependent oxidoreductase (luciferase family)